MDYELGIKQSLGIKCGIRTMFKKLGEIFLGNFYIFVVFSNKPDKDWYWPVEILYTSAFLTLFDHS